MTYKDMIALMVFIVVLFALAIIGSYFLNEKQTAAIDFIELPIPVTINPDLK